MVCSVLLLGQVLAIRERRRLYPLLKHRPWLMLLPALTIGVGALVTGVHNEQLFYVLAFLLGVLGPAVPLRVVALASFVAAAGMAIPHITDGSWTIGPAVGAGLLPPLFWLIIEQLARFMLHLHQSRPEPTRRQPRRVRVWVEREAPADHSPPDSDAAQPPEEEAPETGGAALEQPQVDLTARQLEVLLLCAEGLTNREIGDCLQIGAVQVGRHLRNARKGSDVATNAKGVAWGIARAVIPCVESAQ